MSEDPRIERLLDQLLESQATPEEVCADCPELLSVVRTRWRQMRRLGSDLDILFPKRGERQSGEPQLPTIPGYEVQAVLGRGGMGIVFRARHLRLSRPVALKMILAGPYAVREELERFIHEAEAVAGLRHPNIVQVYDAGDCEGRPYFTMELVEGGNLAKKMAGVPQPIVTAAALVATIAEAVEVAHFSGIVHRDLTPANILLTADGTPKVTDFGLARRIESSDITLTGSPIGTPSYMAPEQARGDKRAIGPATDVYALGAILYELLTGRPPFRGESSAATVHQVLFDEPVPPAWLNPRVPRDLDTICLQCLQREPTRRYASAADLAQDLRRFERGEPIVARPLGRVGRLAKWARRRPTAAALYATLLATALLILALIGVHLQVNGQRQATARAAEQDLREADGLMQQSNLNLARAALERAKGRLDAGASADLEKRVAVAEADLNRREAEQETTRQLKQRLEAIRMDRSVIVNGAHVDSQQPDREYEKAFRLAGLDVFEKNPTVIAEWIKTSPACSTLVAALDDWAIVAANSQRRDWLLAAARQADPDPWRDRARDPATFWDTAAVKNLTRTVPPLQEQSVQLLVSLGQRLLKADRSAAIPFLRQVQREHPDDYYANFWLGLALDDPREKVGYFRAALALRPDAEAANYNIGKALDDQGQANESLPYLQRAVQIDPLNPLSRAGLGEDLYSLGQTDEAIVELRESVRLDPKIQWVRENLGIALEEKGRLDEAIEEFEVAVRIDPNVSEPHCRLAEVLSKLGRQTEALKQCDAAITADPKSTRARTLLIQILSDMGRSDEAEDHFRKVVLASGLNGREALHAALIRQGRLDEARATWQTELATDPSDHDAWFGYAELCLFLGDDSEYHRNCQEMLTRFATSADADVIERIGRTCLFLPASNDELHQAALLIDRALAAHDPKYEPFYPYFQFAKGLSEFRLDRFDSAIALMQGPAKKVMGPSPRLVVAMAQCRAGKKDEAMKTLAAAIISYDWRATKADSIDPWIAHILRREAETLILPNLPAFLEGKYQPRDNDERLALMGICEFKDLRAAMAGLYADAFAADPKLAEDLKGGHRYNAACAAAVAGCGGGADGPALSESERARWRAQARQWLMVNLAARTKQMQAANPADRERLRETLAHWEDDSDLAGLREPASLNHLPPDERQQCRALWSDVQARLTETPTTR